jgi:NAD(P)H-dependent flavin oxidoreductase YrpB (nitropropane dioxygenase family)
MIAAAASAATAAAVLFWGDPTTLVEPSHEAEVNVLMQEGSVGEAMAAAEAGVDSLMTQGIEAGNHVRGTTSIWEMLPSAVARFAPIPLLASGGIGDGAGLPHALRLGVAGVSLGRRDHFMGLTWVFVH